MGIEAEMVERVARALVLAEQDQWATPAADWTISALYDHGLLQCARAAIAAMREPSPDVVLACQAVMIASADEAREAWAAGIDAALGEVPA